MERIILLAVGGFSEESFSEISAEYIKRLSKWVKIKTIEIDPRRFKSLSCDERKEREFEAVEKNLPKGAVLIACDEKGRQFSTMQFAKFIEKQLESPAPMVFALGGADGWSPRMPKRANLMLSLSALTFPHQLARVILSEQLYRAFSIIHDHPYHRS